MPTYDYPQREFYFIPSAAWGATTDTITMIGPKGKKGLVRDIIAGVTADMVGTTTVPEVDVGTSSGDVTYGRFRLGTAAGTGYTNAQAAVRRASQVAGNGGANAVPTLEDFTGHVKLATAPIPADTAFVITRKAGVGGTPAGTGPVTVLIEWF